MLDTHQQQSEPIKAAGEILLPAALWAFKEWEGFQHRGKPETVTSGETWRQAARGHWWLSLLACLLLWLSGGRKDSLEGVRALKRDAATRLQTAQHMILGDSDRFGQATERFGKAGCLPVLDVNRLLKTPESF